MNSEHKDRCLCPVCEGDAKESQRNGGFTVLVCKRCGHGFVYPVPTTVQLAAHYDGEYYEPWIAEQFTARQRMWRNRLRRISRHTTEGSLLDVGCGNGAFLKMAKDGGWKVSGTEVSEWACQHVREELGVEVFQGELTSLDLGEHKWDVITLWHVLEHMADPLETLWVVNKHLSKNGMVVVEVPNQKNVIFQLAYQLARRKRLLLFEEGSREWHLQHFTETSLALILNNAGFISSRIRPDPDSQVELSKRLIDSVARFAGLISRRNWSATLLAFAGKGQTV